MSSKRARVVVEPKVEGEDDTPEALAALKADVPLLAEQLHKLYGKYAYVVPTQDQLIERGLRFVTRELDAELNFDEDTVGAEPAELDHALREEALGVARRLLANLELVQNNRTYKVARARWGVPEEPAELADTFKALLEMRAPTKLTVRSEYRPICMKLLVKLAESF
jgi:hypothetical protein